MMQVGVTRHLFPVGVWSCPLSRGSRNTLGSGFKFVMNVRIWPDGARPSVPALAWKSWYGWNLTGNSRLSNSGPCPGLTGTHSAPPGSLTPPSSLVRQTCHHFTEGGAQVTPPETETALFPHLLGNGVSMAVLVAGWKASAHKGVLPARRVTSVHSRQSHHGARPALPGFNSIKLL